MLQVDPGAQVLSLSAPARPAEVCVAAQIRVAEIVLQLLLELRGDGVRRCSFAGVRSPRVDLEACASGRAAGVCGCSIDTSA